MCVLNVMAKNPEHKYESHGDAGGKGNVFIPIHPGDIINICENFDLLVALE